MYMALLKYHEMVGCFYSLGGVYREVRRNVNNNYDYISGCHVRPCIIVFAEVKLDYSCQFKT